MAQRRYSKQAIVACPETEEDGEKNLTSFDSLPNDLVFNILQRLPAQFLYNSAKSVCKTWAQILQLPFFINSHLQLHSQCGSFLIQDPHSPCKVQSFHTRGFNLQETDINSKFSGTIRGSSGGVLLINKSASNVDLYVANPVTTQVLKLPNLPSTCRLCRNCNNIARIFSNGEIKVISLGRDSVNGMYYWYVVTIGKVMRWRKIEIGNTYAECDPASYLSYVQSLSVNGVVFWTNSSWKTDQCVLAIDLRDETIHNLKVPTEFQGQNWALVKMGREICCMNYGKNVEMKVWMLKDLRRNEWVMIKKVRFCKESPLRKKFCMPLILLDCEILVLSVYVKVSNAVVAYNVSKGEYKVIKIDDVARHAIFLHTDTLVRF